LVVWHFHAGRAQLLAEKSTVPALHERRPSFGSPVIDHGTALFAGMMARLQAKIARKLWRFLCAFPAPACPEERLRRSKERAESIGL
jgi:hypothetical protein